MSDSRLHPEAARHDIWDVIERVARFVPLHAYDDSLKLLEMAASALVDECDAQRAALATTARTGRAKLRRCALLQRPHSSGRLTLPLIGGLCVTPPTPAPTWQSEHATMPKRLPIEPTRNGSWPRSRGTSLPSRTKPTVS